MYRTSILQERVTNVKSHNNAVHVHPQLSHNGHPVEGGLVGAGLLWTLLRVLTPYNVVCFIVGATRPPPPYLVHYTRPKVFSPSYLVLTV